ncbi:hypothetical protein HanIR_Chr08g0382991 [Helianthus annuus]|nr:hypothetical protein HanIR_Chr08g0382991 [Helianthus annuus]
MTAEQSNRSIGFNEPRSWSVVTLWECNCVQIFLDIVMVHDVARHHRYGLVTGLCRHMYHGFCKTMIRLS